MAKKIIFQFVSTLIIIALCFIVFNCYERNKQLKALDNYCFAENHYDTEVYKKCINSYIYDVLNEITDYINSNYVNNIN